jgi:hypothetical protein
MYLTVCIINSDLDKILLVSDLPERNCYVSGGVSDFHFPSNLFSFDSSGLERCWIYEVDRQKNIVVKQHRASNWTVPSRRQVPWQLYRLRNLHPPVTLITYFPCLWFPSSRVQTRPKPLDFSVSKILSMPSFVGEVKQSVPCPNFAACKRT